MQENRNRWEKNIMTTARLMDSPEDYKNLGINPSEIEVWEDSRRNNETGKGNWE